MLPHKNSILDKGHKFTSKNAKGVTVEQTTQLIDIKVSQKCRDKEVDFSQLKQVRLEGMFN